MDKQSEENITYTQDEIAEFMNGFEADNPRPDEYQTDPRIDKLLDEILTREDFSYDAMNDPLYQQYRESYLREGDRAMRETLAEAAAGAGGMNTYAITAAQQANNYYNSQLNDKIPELYQLAYNMYLNDKASQVENLGLLQNMDSTQYARYRDTMNDWYNDKNFAYGTYLDAVNQGNWLTNYNTNAMLDNRDFTNNNYWANKEFDYNDAWKNKEWDAYKDEVSYNREQDDYNKQLTEQEIASNEVWRLVELGITPNADLIAKAGLNATDIANAAKVVKEELDKLGVSTKSTTSTTGTTSTKNGYTGTTGTTDNTNGYTGTTGTTGNTGNTNGYTGTTGTTGTTTKTTGSQVIEDSIKKVTDVVSNVFGSDKEEKQKETDAMRSVASDLGISVATNPNRVVALYEVGAIYDDKNGKTHWSSGWNAQNFNSKLNSLGK
jgi:hypothetical protein